MPAPQVLPLASAKAPSAVHGVAWLPVPAAAGAHLAAVGGTPLYTLSGTTNLRLDAAAPTPAAAPSTLRCCCVVGGGGGGGECHAILAGAADGALRAWALDGRGGLVETQATASSPAHAGGVQALATPAGSNSSPSPTFASAGSDGTLAVWDGRAPLADGPPMRLEHADSASATSGPAWAVAMAGGPCTSADPVLLAGHATGLLRTWCLRTGRVRWAGRLPGGPGVCGVGLGPHTTDAGGPGTYFAGATGGLVAALEAGTCHPVHGLAATAARLGGGEGAGGPPPTVWTALPLPGSRGIVGCACGDGRLRLLRHRRAAGSARAAAGDGRPAGAPGSLASLASAKLGDQALTCLSWSTGHAGLFATGGMDEGVRAGVVPKAGVV